jgi:hypothetical protein
VHLAERIDERRLEDRRVQQGPLLGGCHCDDS